MRKAFDIAKKAYLLGDPRKLADLVRANALTPEEAAFVAQALDGEVEIKDGRAEKGWTRNLYYDFVEIKLNGDLKKTLFGDKARVSRAAIYRALAERHGYSDADTVKKAIERAEKRRDNNISSSTLDYHERVASSEFLDFAYRMKESGRAFEFTIPADVIRQLAALYPLENMPKDFDPGDLVLNLDSQIAFAEALRRNRDTIKK